MQEKVRVCFCGMWNLAAWSSAVRFCHQWRWWL